MQKKYQNQKYQQHIQQISTTNKFTSPEQNLDEPNPTLPVENEQVKNNLNISNTTNLIISNDILPASKRLRENDIDLNRIILKEIKSLHDDFNIFKSENKSIGKYLPMIKVSQNQLRLNPKH